MKRNKFKKLTKEFIATALILPSENTIYNHIEEIDFFMLPLGEPAALEHVMNHHFLDEVKDQVGAESIQSNSPKLVAALELLIQKNQEIIELTSQNEILRQAVEQNQQANVAPVGPSDVLPPGGFDSSSFAECSATAWVTNDHPICMNKQCAKPFNRLSRWRLVKCCSEPSLIDNCFVCV